MKLYRPARRGAWWVALLPLAALGRGLRFVVALLGRRAAALGQAALVAVLSCGLLPPAPLYASRRDTLAALQACGTRGSTVKTFSSPSGRLRTTPRSKHLPCAVFAFHATQTFPKFRTFPAGGGGGPKKSRFRQVPFVGVVSLRETPNAPPTPPSQSGGF